MINCGKCKFWEHIRDEDFTVQGETFKGPHGTCLRINMEERDNAWLWGMDDEDMADCGCPDAFSLVTRDTFSCPLFSEGSS